MDTQRIESFKQFAQYLEYPMVVFEAESGNVLDINYEAEVLLGTKVANISIAPGRTFTKHSFWDVLHGKKSLIWHRIRMIADNKEYLVSGLINEMIEADTRIYTLLFERRADLNIGSLTLESIVNHAGIVAIHVERTGEGESDFRVGYTSQNINQYGYTRGQLYERAVTLQEMVCTEDYEKICAMLKASVEKHADEDIAECRLLTEERELIPVRIWFRYIYNDFGFLTDIELLITDLREEYRKNSENAYLSNAITKMKNVLIVKSYQAGKRTLRYISPNANFIGMNADALRKGYKLTEDYIHPEDRDNVLDAVYQAIANSVANYVQVYRMVRDDGKQIWVESEVMINRISDGEAEISFLLTDITARKNMEKEIAATLEETETTLDNAKSSSVDCSATGISSFGIHDKNMISEFQMLQDALCKNANYYTLVLDEEGKQLTTPAGPDSDMGLFYDLVERPLYKEKFATVVERAKDQRVPISISLDVDGMEVHMVFAPLMIEDKVIAYWMLTSFLRDGARILGDVTENQWILAGSIVKHYYSKDVVQKESKNRKVAELQLRKEQTERRVIEDIIASMVRERDMALNEMCHKIGAYLCVENIAIYLESKEKGKIETCFAWNQSDEDTTFFDIMELSKSEYGVVKESFKKNPLLIADTKGDDLFLREIAKRTDKAIAIHKMELASGTQGYVVLGDDNRSREFDAMELHFIKVIATVFGNFISHRQKRTSPDVVKSGLLESYDHIRDAVFVKDNRTGEIIFANKAADKLFGYSIVNMRASDVVNDQMEQYRNIGGVKKRFIDNRKVTKWQTYMKELDQIMNIVEVHMETLYGEDWNLFVLKKNKNKKKDS